MDKLDKIFQYQNELQNIIKGNNSDRHFYHDPEPFQGYRIFMILSSIIAESTETQRETSFKHWKSTKGLNKSKIKEEVIDIFHFLVMLALEIGLTPDEILEEYEKKRQTNIERQKNNY